jgi:hypothetical protein
MAKYVNFLNSSPKRALATTGAGIIILALSAGSIVSELSRHAPISGALPFSMHIGPPSFDNKGTEDWGIIQAHLSTKLAYNSNVMSNSSFIVSLDVDLDSAVFLPTSVSPKFDNATIRKSVIHELSILNPTFTLILSGAEIEPKGPNRLSADGCTVQPDSMCTKWSVHVKEPGQLDGFVRPNFPKVVDNNGNIKTKYQLENDLPISVNVQERLFTWTKIISWVGVFFGPLLTLPGLLAFFQQRRAQQNVPSRRSARRRARSL